MKKHQIWQKPTINEVQLDTEISILMTSPPPGDPFSENTNHDTIVENPYG